MSNTPPVPFISPDNWRVTPITPFTYRDGLTYLEVLERLRERDVELVNMINDGLAGAADDLNAAIAKLWDDLVGPMAQISEFRADMDLRFAEILDELRLAEGVFQRRVLQMVEDALRDPDIQLYNWHRGERTQISVVERDADNHYAAHGLTAGDWTRKGWTVEDIEDLPANIEQLTYRGIFVGERANPEHVKANERTGKPSSWPAQIAAVAQTTYGDESINVPCDTISFTASSAPLRKVG